MVINIKQLKRYLDDQTFAYYAYSSLINNLFAFLTTQALSQSSFQNTLRSFFNSQASVPDSIAKIPTND